MHLFCFEFEISLPRMTNMVLISILLEWLCTCQTLLALFYLFIDEKRYASSRRDHKKETETERDTIILWMVRRSQCCSCHSYFIHICLVVIDKDMNQSMFYLVFSAARQTLSICEGSIIPMIGHFQGQN